MIPLEEKDMRDLIGELERKLNETITAGLTTVNLTIAQLTDAHHRALLEQEKRNSQFAPRDRVDDIARRLDRAEEQLDRVGRLEQAIDKLAQSIASLESKSAAYGMKFLGSAGGYLTMLVINLMAVLLTYLLTRGGH